MLDKVNALLFLAGFRLMRNTDLALLVTVASAAQNERDKLAKRVVEMKAALNKIRLTLTANTEQCLHCQAPRFVPCRKTCPARIAVEAIADGTEMPAAMGKEMN